MTPPTTDIEALAAFRAHFSPDAQPELERIYQVWRSMGVSVRAAFDETLQEMVRAYKRQEKAE